MALGATAKLHTFGIAKTGLAVVLGIVLSNVVVNRLGGYVILLFVDVASALGNISGISDLDMDEAESFSQEVRPIMLLGMPFFSFIGIGSLKKMRWTCATANPSGGPTHAICSWFEPGPFQDALLFLTRLTMAGFGVGGVLFLVVFFIELRCGWRNSIFQKRYRNSSLYTWFHPMAELHQSVQKDSTETEE